MRVINHFYVPQGALLVSLMSYTLSVLPVPESVFAWLLFGIPGGCELD